MIDQLSIFLENETGRLADVVRDIADARINIHSLFVADTESFGVARLLCDRPAYTVDYLKKKGWRARLTKVVAVNLPDTPGSLSVILDVLEDAHLNLEYVYCVSRGSSSAVDILKVSDIESVESLLTNAGFCLADPKDVYELD